MYHVNRLVFSTLECPIAYPYDSMIETIEAQTAERYTDIVISSCIYSALDEKLYGRDR